MLLLMVAGMSAARAVIVSGGDGSGNLTGDGVSGWDYVGAVGGASGVYLGSYDGNDWVLTAAHVGAGAFTLNGVSYSAVADSAVPLTGLGGALADLTLFRIDGSPGLMTLDLSVSTPLVGQSVTMIGYGVNRDASLTYWKPDWTETTRRLQSMYQGYKWTGTSAKRWGTNVVTGTKTEGATDYLLTTFTSLSGAAQATVGDSGGGVFVMNVSTLELAGVMGLVSSYPGQPELTSVDGTQTYSADISRYRSQILNVIAAVATPVPEPRTVALLFLGGVALLARRRRG
jgi:hypothetical protein